MNSQPSMVTWKGRFIALRSSSAVQAELQRVNSHCKARRLTRRLERFAVARNGVQALDYLFAEGIHLGRNLSLLRRIRADDRTKLLRSSSLAVPTKTATASRGYGLRANSYVRKPVDFHPLMEVGRQLGLYRQVLNQPPSVAESK